MSVPAAKSGLLEPFPQTSDDCLRVDIWSLCSSRLLLLPVPSCQYYNLLFVVDMETIGLRRPLHLHFVTLHWLIKAAFKTQTLLNFIKKLDHYQPIEIEESLKMWIKIPADLCKIFVRPSATSSHWANTWRPGGRHPGPDDARDTFTGGWTAAVLLVVCCSFTHSPSHSCTRWSAARVTNVKRSLNSQRPWMMLMILCF